MLEEVESDIKEQKVFLSPRLRAFSTTKYISILKQSIESWNDVTLAREIQQGGLLKSMEMRTKRSGVVYPVKVPRNAHISLAEGEFNRYYIRGVCRKAISSEKRVEVYRAKPVRDPRSKSQRLIGTTVNPERLLSDLRRNIGVDVALGIPGGVNSGLSVRFKIH